MDGKLPARHRNYTILTVNHARLKFGGIRSSYPTQYLWDDNRAQSFPGCRSRPQAVYEYNHFNTNQHTVISANHHFGTNTQSQNRQQYLMVITGF